jgi:hypothetical protein
LSPRTRSGLRHPRKFKDGTEPCASIVDIYQQACPIGQSEKFGEMND